MDRFKDQTEQILNFSLGKDTAPLVIGKRADGTYPFRGHIDEIKFFDRALSATEVSALFATY